MAAPTCSNTMSGRPPSVLARPRLQKRRDSLYAGLLLLGRLAARGASCPRTRCGRCTRSAPSCWQSSPFSARGDDRRPRRRRRACRAASANTPSPPARAPDEHAGGPPASSAWSIEHPVGGEVRQAVGGGLLPASGAGGLGSSCCAWTLQNCGERAPGGLVAPDLLRRRGQRVEARAPPGPRRRPGCSATTTSSPGFQRVTPSPTFHDDARRRRSRRCRRSSLVTPRRPTPGLPSAAQTLLKPAPTAITGTTTSPSPAPAPRSSSSCVAGPGSPNRSSRYTPTVVVADHRLDRLGDCDRRRLASTAILCDSPSRPVDGTWTTAARHEHDHRARRGRRRRTSTWPHVSTSTVGGEAVGRRSRMQQHRPRRRPRSRSRRWHAVDRVGAGVQHVGGQAVQVVVLALKLRRRSRPGRCRRPGAGLLAPCRSAQAPPDRGRRSSRPNWSRWPTASRRGSMHRPELGGRSGAGARGAGASPARQPLSCSIRAPKLARSRWRQR